MGLNINSVLIIGCTIIIILMKLVILYLVLYKREKNKRQEDWMKKIEDKIDNIGLTKRQIEIFKEVMNGKTSKEIAEEKFISEDTVQTHRKNINRILKEKGIGKQIIINL